LGEALSIGAALKWIGTELDRTAFEAAQAFERVLRPADRFPEFAVADHIDAGFGLAANDGGDRLGQARLVGLRVERFARLLRAQECLQRLRPYQAADMGGEDAVAAAFHVAGSTFDDAARLLAELHIRGQSGREIIGCECRLGSAHLSRPGPSMPPPLANAGTPPPLALRLRPAIRIRDLRKMFGQLIAIDGVSVDIAHGEFFMIVGPSGCGKTTLLRILAGLESVTSGTIEIATPNSQRPVNSMIFQGDSIFPWMT